MSLSRAYMDYQIKKIRNIFTVLLREQIQQLNIPSRKVKPFCENAGIPLATFNRVNEEDKEMYFSTIHSIFEKIGFRFVISVHTDTELKIEIIKEAGESADSKDIKRAAKEFVVSKLDSLGINYKNVHKQFNITENQVKSLTVKKVRSDLSSIMNSLVDIGGGVLIKTSLSKVEITLNK